jgi:maleate isomerase
MAGVSVIGQNTLDAVASVMTAEPDSLVMGMSAVTFIGGAAGADEFRKKLEDAGRVKAATGSHACAQALQAYGNISRIAFMSPYFPAANAEVKRFFQDVGYEVVRETCLQCPRWTAIARVPPGTVRDTFLALDGDDVDAIVQVGTNLSAVKLAAAAELWLGKPVIAINTAIYWQALRMNGIQDKIEGFGRLLAEF